MVPHSHMSEKNSRKRRKTTHTQSNKSFFTVALAYDFYQENIAFES